MVIIDFSDLIVGPRSFSLLGNFGVVSLLCQVHCWGRFYCWAADIVCYIVGCVHCSVGFIVGAGNCWC